MKPKVQLAWLADAGESRHHLPETGDLQRQGCLTQEASMLGLDPGTGCREREGTGEELASPGAELTLRVRGALEGGALLF